MASEVEVKVRSDVKIEVRFSKRLSRYTSIQNFRFLALKMTELWQFEIKCVMYGTLKISGTLVTFKSNSKSDKVDLANIQSPKSQITEVYHSLLKENFK